MHKTELVLCFMQLLILFLLKSIKPGNTITKDNNKGDNNEGDISIEEDFYNKDYLKISEFLASNKSIDYIKKITPFNPNLALIACFLSDKENLKKYVKNVIRNLDIIKIGIIF